MEIVLPFHFAKLEAPYLLVLFPLVLVPYQRLRDPKLYIISLLDREVGIDLVVTMEGS